MYSIYKMASSTQEIKIEYQSAMGVNMPEDTLNVDTVLFKSTMMYC